jgi:hypothetical protein
LIGGKHANKCLIMAAVAYNLKKVPKFNNKRPITAVATLLQEVQNFFYFSILHSNLANGPLKSKKSACRPSYQGVVRNSPILK